MSDTLINLPTAIEMVICFQDNHMIIIVDSPKVIEHGKTLYDAIIKSWIEKVPILVTINGLNGQAFVLANLVQGFYFRPAHSDTTAEFQRKVLELHERGVKAAEKCADGDIPGEEWKNKNV